MSGVFHGLTIRQKLLGLLGLMLVLLLGQGGYGLYTLNQTAKEDKGVVERRLPIMNSIAEVRSQKLLYRLDFERALRQIQTAPDQLPKTIEDMEQANRDTLEQLDQAIKITEASIQSTHNPKSKEMYQMVLEAIKANLEDHQAMSAAASEMVKQPSVDEARLDALIQHARASRTLLDTAYEDIQTYTHKGLKVSGEIATTATTISIVLTALGAILGSVIAIQTIRGIHRSLSTAVSSVRTMADGDLKTLVTARSHDEIGEMLTSLATMRDNMHHLLTDIQHSAGGLAGASAQMARVSEDTSKSMRQQQSETDQLATAINEMSATVREVANNTASAASAAGEARQTALQGQDVVAQTVATINALAREVSETASAINSLGEESEKVGAVLDVIRGIAEQTNLLALNAAIEAARAGEQGRGFAVVADEVRTLASRTHESTQEIQKMIASLQTGARASVQRMENSSRAVEAGVTQGAAAGKALESLLLAVERIADMNTQIASAAEEQTAVTDEIERNIMNIRGAADGASAAMSETTATSAEVATTARTMQGLVGRFRL